MVSIVKSCTLKGMSAEITRVECDVSRGMPMLNIVGLPDAAVRESKERLRAAIKNSGQTFPVSRRITVNLAPAGTKKEGTHLDLAIAVCLLICADEIKNERTEEVAVIGELSLDGKINPVDRIAAMLIGLRENDIRSVMIPAGNLDEAIIIEGIDLYPVEDLSQAYGFMCKTIEINAVKGRRPSKCEGKLVIEEDFSDVRGSYEAKRAVEICVGGFHHLLLTGPPGCGKSMVAKRIPTVLPDMDYEEMLETAGIYSVLGGEACRDIYNYKRPFRNPSANISTSAMTGGGNGMPRPGEISLAHNGVLFLDEMPEFRRDVIESLRQPLEDEMISISRTSGKIDYPCKFILVGARNPCPCGYINDPEHRCTCTPMQIKRYGEKISGPIMDRFDIFVDMAVERDDITGEFRDICKEIKSSVDMKASINKARELQKNRYINEDFRYNSQLKGKHLKRYCYLDRECREMYELGCRSLKVSGRGADKILRVTRTIADLSGEEDIKLAHLAEAFQFRRRDGEGN